MIARCRGNVGVFIGMSHGTIAGARSCRATADIFLRSEAMDTERGKPAAASPIAFRI